MGDWRAIKEGRSEGGVERALSLELVDCSLAEEAERVVMREGSEQLLSRITRPELELLRKWDEELRIGRRMSV